MTTQEWMWCANASLLAVAVLAGVADWRRGKRRDLDNPGWVPWRGIQATALFAFLLLTIVLALKAR